MEKKKENKEVAENKIFSNFRNHNFLKNLKILYKYINNIYENEFKHDIDIKKNKTNKDINKNELSNGKKIIIHLIPSKDSTFYKIVNEKKKEVLKKYGVDDTYKYDIHISLTGFFFCSNIKIFLFTFCIYIYCYVKSFYINTIKVNSIFNIYKNIYMNSFFFNYNIQEKKKNNLKIKFNQKTIKKNIQENVKVENEIFKQKKNNYTHIICTKDGYVIIPVFCNWIKFFFEKFYNIIKNNNFILYKKKNLQFVNKNVLKTKSILSLEKTNKFNNYVNNIMNCYDNKLYFNILLLKDNICNKKKNENINNIENINEINNQNTYNLNNVENNKKRKIYISNEINDLNCDLKNKKIKKSNIQNNKQNQLIYKMNNNIIKLDGFRIKDCDHISLASNRNDKKIQNEIFNLYKNINFYNCSWNLVIYKENENFQDNNLLKEIFRLNNFAVS